VGLPIIVNLVQNINVGSLSGSVGKWHLYFFLFHLTDTSIILNKGSPIGNIDYNLDNIVIQSIQVGSANVAITGYGLSVVITDLTANVYLDWSYREVSCFLYWRVEEKKTP